jgi:uncharacterized protein involved in outer membrane biogenesis
LLLLIAGIAGIVILGGYAYLKTRDPEQVRQVLETGLGSTLGREVRMSGPVEVTLAPLPAVTVRDVTLANAAWGTRPQMLTVEQLEVQPALFSLLTGHLVLNQVRIRGARVFLENGPEGAGNWQFDLKTQSADDDRTIEVKSIAGSDLEVSYYNNRRGVTRDVVLDFISMGAASPQNSLSVTAKGTVMDVDLELNGNFGSPAAIAEGQSVPVDLEVKLGDSRFTAKGRLNDTDFRDFDGVDLMVSASGRRPRLLMELIETPIPLVSRFTFEGRLVGGPTRMTLEDFDGKFATDSYDISLTGSVGDLATLKGIDLAVKAAGQSMKDLLPAMDASWRETDSFEGAAQLLGDFPELRLQDADISARLAGSGVRMSGRIGDLLHEGDLSIDVEIAGSDTERLARVTGLPIPDIDSVDLKGQISGTWVDTRASGLQAQLVDQSLRADLKGSIDDLGELEGIDLTYDLQGRNFDDLAVLLSVPELIETESVHGSGRLVGDRHDLTLFVDDAKMTQGSLQLTGSGRILDLADVPQLDLGIRLTGTSIKDIDIGEQPFPATDSFAVSGRLKGAAVSPDLENVDAEARLGNITMKLQGRFPNVLDSQRFSADAQLEGDNLSILGATMGLTWPASRSFSLQGHAGGTWEHPSLQSMTGSLTTDNVRLDLTGDMGDVLATRGIDLVINASAPTLTPLLPWGGELWDKLGELDTRFSMSGGPRHFDVDISQLSIGESRLSGRFDIGLDGSGDLSAISGQFGGGTLDLTPWLATEGSGTPGSQNDPGRPRRLFSRDPLPLAWLDGYSINTDLSGLDLKLGDSSMQVQEGRLRVDGGILNIDPFKIRYRDADLDGRLRVDGRQTPVLEFRGRTLGFDVGHLARRAGISQDARGKFDLLVDVTATGQSSADMAASSNGRLIVLMTEGHIPEQALPLNALDVFIGLMPGLGRPKGMTIECAMVDMPVDEGIASAHVMSVDTPNMLLIGTGTIDLGKEKIKLLFDPRAKHARVVAHGARVKLSGPLTQPKTSLDVTRTGTRIAGAAARIAALGPAGLFVSRDTFRRDRQECAESLEQMQQAR